MICFKTAKNKDEQDVCRYCKTKAKLVYAASVKMDGNIYYAYRCSNCKKIVWGKKH